MKSTSGLTLIEVILALTLSLLILSIVSVIYLSAEKSFQMQISLSAIQENMRTAFMLLKNEIQMAGYIGCAKLTDEFPIRNLGQYSITNQNKISIEKNSITIRHASIDHANLIKNMQGNSTLYVTAKPRFEESEILLISDCQSAEIFQVKTVSHILGGQKMTSSRALLRKYEKNAEISKLDINRYFISDTYRQQKKPLYALFLHDINGRAFEIIESVDTLNVKVNQNIIEMDAQFSVPENLFLLSNHFKTYIALRE